MTETAAKELISREKCLAVLSPTCILVIAIPLLIPGLTLTIVGSNENGFDRYSALHIVGIILLSFSSVLVVVAVVLWVIHCKDNGRIAPDLEDGCSLDSDSLEGYEIQGHVHSTHAAKEPHPETEKNHESVKEKREALPRRYTNHMLPDQEDDEVKPETSTAISQEYRPNDARNGDVARSEQESRAQRTRQVARAKPSVEARPGVVQTRPGGPERRNTCNYMDVLTDGEEQQLADRYAAVANTLPRDKFGMIRNMSTLSDSSPSDSDSEDDRISEEPEEGLQDEEETVSVFDTDSPQHRGLVQALLHQQAASSGQGDNESLDTGRSVKTQAPGSAENSQERSSSAEESPSSHPAAARPALFTVQEEGADPSHSSTDRLFLSRKPPSGEDSGDAEQRRKKKKRRDKTGGERSSRKSKEASVHTTSTSSFEITESPSHGTYSVRSFESEELQGLVASPDTGNLEGREEGMTSQSRMEPLKFTDADSRPYSPVPLKAAPSPHHDSNGEHVTVFAKTVSSTEGKSSRSASSMDSSPTKHRRHLKDSSNTDSAKYIDDEDVTGRKKKKKKKKKKSRENVEDADAGVGEAALGGELNPPLGQPETDVGHVTGSDVDPISILHHHHTDHHVHWPDQGEPPIPSS